MKHKLSINHISKYLAYFILLTILVTGISYSRFRTANQGDDTARVAKAIAHYERGKFLRNGVDVGRVENDEVVASDLQPGDIVQYHFLLKNYDDKSINEVSLLCTFHINVDIETLIPDAGEIGKDREVTVWFQPVNSMEYVQLLPSAGETILTKVLPHASAVEIPFYIQVRLSTNDADPDKYVGSRLSIQLKIDAQQIIK